MMGSVIQFRASRVASYVQLSAYPQDDGAKLYAVEVLYSDDTWSMTAHSRDIAEGWKLAGVEAIRRKVPLLPQSTFPGKVA